MSRDVADVVREAGDMADGHPRVSICIPSYRPQNLERLLRSIARQTYTDYEVVISDDCPTDAIRQMAAGIAADQAEGMHLAHGGACVRYYRNDPPLGMLYNWNRMLELARGELIKIMFEDDWFTFPDSLERLVALLDEKPEAGFAFCGSRQTPLGEMAGQPYDRAASPEYIRLLTEDYRNMFLANEIGAPSATLYRACGATFDVRTHWVSDLVLYIRVLEHNPVFACTSEPLISIGLHEGQMTKGFQARDMRKYEDYLLMYQDYALVENENCRRKMLERTVAFGQGWPAARQNGARLGEYLRQRLIWFWQNTILGYWGGLKHKLKKLSSRSR